MYDYIRPQKLLDALKVNNPFIEQWVEEAVANHEELYQYLVKQDDKQMYTECRQPENEGRVSSNSTGFIQGMGKGGYRRMCGSTYCY